MLKRLEEIGRGRVDVPIIKLSAKRDIQKISATFLPKYPEHQASSCAYNYTPQHIMASTEIASAIARQAPKLGRKPIYLYSTPQSHLGTINLTRFLQSQIHNHPPPHPRPSTHLRLIHRPSRTEQTRHARLPLQCLRRHRARRSILHPTTESHARQAWKADPQS